MFCSSCGAWIAVMMFLVPFGSSERFLFFRKTHCCWILTRQKCLAKCPVSFTLCTVVHHRRLALKNSPKLLSFPSAAPPSAIIEGGWWGENLNTQTFTTQLHAYLKHQNNVFQSKLLLKLASTPEGAFLYFFNFNVTKLKRNGSYIQKIEGKK